MWYRTVEDYSIHTSAKWSCRKNEQNVDGKGKKQLSGTRLGCEFWAEAVDTTCYLVKKSPSSALEDKNPDEV